MFARFDRIYDNPAISLNSEQTVRRKEEKHKGNCRGRKIKSDELLSYVDYKRKITGGKLSRC
nr:hypothetical protein [Acetivibrio ethanolgignens]